MLVAYALVVGIIGFAIGISDPPMLYAGVALLVLVNIQALCSQRE